MLSHAKERHSPGKSGLAGQRVLVSGASSGIGRGVALALAQADAEVILLARGASQLEEVASEIEAIGARCEIVAADITDLGAIAARLRSLPRLDGLVSCAGRNIPGPFGTVRPDQYDAIFDLNVKAAFFLAQECVQQFRRHGDGGAIVHVSSQMGHVGAANRTVYCASKHAIEGLTKAMSVELAPEGIRVNSVCPTFIETAMTKPMFADPAFEREVLSKIPLGRIGSVDDVVGAVLFLLSPSASLITGASLVVDGGWTAQ